MARDGAFGWSPSWGESLILGSQSAQDLTFSSHVMAEERRRGIHSQDLRDFVKVTPAR